MKKFIQTIENAIKRGKEKYPNEDTFTIRRDVVERALIRGAYTKCECVSKCTNDYAYDAETNFGKGEVTGKEVVERIRKDTQCTVERKNDYYVVSINVHGNLFYEALVPLKTDLEKVKKNSVNPEKNKETQITTDTPYTSSGHQKVLLNGNDTYPKIDCYDNVIDARELFAKRALS